MTRAVELLRWAATHAQKEDPEDLFDRNGRKLAWGSREMRRQLRYPRGRNCLEAAILRLYGSTGEPGAHRLLQVLASYGLLDTHKPERRLQEIAADEECENALQAVEAVRTEWAAKGRSVKESELFARAVAMGLLPSSSSYRSGKRQLQRYRGKRSWVGRPGDTGLMLRVGEYDQSEVRNGATSVTVSNIRWEPDDRHTRARIQNRELVELYSSDEFEDHVRMERHKHASNSSLEQMVRDREKAIVALNALLAEHGLGDPHGGGWLQRRRFERELRELAARDPRVKALCDRERRLRGASADLNYREQCGKIDGGWRERCLGVDQRQPPDAAKSRGVRTRQPVRRGQLRVVGGTDAGPVPAEATAGAPRRRKGRSRAKG